MKATWSIAVFGAIVSIAIGLLGSQYGVPVVASHAKLQGSLFTGFLTLAGFVLSLKTNILLKLQKDLFDSAEYKDWIDDFRVNNPNTPINRYDALESLGRFLVSTVICCIGASILQVTLGFIGSPWTIGVCIGSAAMALAFAVVAWWAIRKNLNIWFSILKKSDGAAHSSGGDTKH